MSSVLKIWIPGVSKAVPLLTCRRQRRRKYSSYSFLNSAPDGVSGQHHDTAAIYRWGKDPDIHWTGGWVGLRAGLYTEARGKILWLCQGSNPGHLVEVQKGQSKKLKIICIHKHTRLACFSNVKTRVWDLADMKLLAKSTQIQNESSSNCTLQPFIQLF
jgi:hypothetical protein